MHKDGESLINAVRCGAVDEIRRLVRAGADPSTRDLATGLTALMIAAGTGNASTMQVLLDAGADPLSTDSRAGATALHKAVQGGNLETVRLLVNAGAFIDAVTATLATLPSWTRYGLSGRK